MTDLNPDERTGTEITGRVEGLPLLIEKAAAALASASTAAEVLEAKSNAKVAYEAAKLAAQFARQKDAHATVMAACRKCMGDALVIEAQAMCLLADQFDAAQERGEVGKPGQQDRVRDNIQNTNIIALTEDIGLTSVLVHEARIVRDAEKREPGIVRRTVDARLQANEAPTRAEVKRATAPPKPKTQTVHTPPPPQRPPAVEEQVPPPASDGYEEAREYLGVPEDRMPDALRQTPLGRAMMRYMEARSVIDWYFEGVAKGRGIPWGEEYRDNRDDEFEAEERLIDQMMLALGLWQPSEETRHALDLLDELYDQESKS